MAIEGSNYEDGVAEALESAAVVVERMDLARVAGKMVGAVEYLERVIRVHMAEGDNPYRLVATLGDLVWARGRVVELSRSLPEGPLEAFASEHPLIDDPIDGPYCGYGDKHGRPCPVRDPARHWDAWELMGTRHKRPETAVRTPEARL